MYNGQVDYKKYTKYGNSYLNSSENEQLFSNVCRISNKNSSISRLIKNLSQSKKCTLQCSCYIEEEVPYDFSGATPSAAKGQFAHPSIPLNAEETKMVIEGVLKDNNYLKIPKNAARFASVILQEPPKEYVLQWKPNQGTKRVAQTLVYDTANNRTLVVLTDLASGKIFLSKFVRIIPPLGTLASPLSEVPDIISILQNDSNVAISLRRRGLSPNDLTSNPPKIGIFDIPFDYLVQACKENSRCQELINPCDGNKRIFILTFVLFLNGRDILENFVLGWIDGLIVLVNSTDKSIYKVIDEYVAPLPKVVHDPITPIPIARPLNPIIHSQANPSYMIDGNEVTWHNWKFRFSWHPRTGVQLYNIGYTVDGGRNYRSILYKLSIDESGAYYNVDEPIFVRSLVSYDSDAYPLLSRVRPLIPGLDVPAYATFFDIPIVLPDGNIELRPNAFAIYEQIGEVIYRARNPTNCDQSCITYVGSDQNQVLFPPGECLGSEFKCNNSGSRDQELCVRFYFSGIIYLWMYTFVFSTSGRIRVDIDVSARALYNVSQNDTLWSSLITKNRNAFNHTHYWNIRADFDIDGVRNTVVEENQYSSDLGCCKDKTKCCCKKSKLNKLDTCGQTVFIEETILESEKKAVRDHDFQTNRSWIVVNDNVKNRLGKSVGYAIIPQFNIGKSLASNSSWPHMHFSFLKHHLHVTKYNDTEQYAGGNFPLMACHDVGIGKYIEDDENLVNEDIVVWYTIIFSHVPHSEDMPFVITKKLSVLFEPHNFFEFNPSTALGELEHPVLIQPNLNHHSHISLEHPGRRPPEHPGRPPTGHPGGPPVEHPDGPPVEHPGGPPVEHPGGPPVEHPGGPPVEHPGGPPVEHPGGPPVEHPGGPPVEHPGGPPVEHPGGWATRTSR
ncbi:MAG: hypothetical protein QW303_06005 [Nitrososphaerota archaeon]